MRHLALVILASLQLGRARQHGFSIHDDVLAHPQFEIVFASSYISERDADLLLSGTIRRPSQTADDATDTAAQTETDLAGQDGSPAAAAAASGFSFDERSDATDDGRAQVSETYEVMRIPPSRYLCSIPVLAPAAEPNKTATDLAQAEETRTLVQAANRGVQLINTMGGECMYYISGWWSYSFCYGHDVVQFHALTTKLGKPVKDPHSQEYTLGRMNMAEREADDGGGGGSHSGSKKGGAGPGHGRHGRHDGRSHNKRSYGAKAGDVTENRMGDVEETATRYRPSTDGGVAVTDAFQTELQVRGDERFMVQRLGDGTMCDLTGRERTIEIQYHCSPGSTMDRISWIKEVSTCSYLMEVRTPRLCQEVAFRPPKPMRAHPIECRMILGTSEAEAAVAAAARQKHQRKVIEAAEEAAKVTAEATSEAALEKPTATNLGDILSILEESLFLDAFWQEVLAQGGYNDADAAQSAAKAMVSARHKQTEKANNGAKGLVIGGVVVGERQALGHGEDGTPPVRLEPPGNFAHKAAEGGAKAGNTGSMSEERVVAVLARGQSAQDGGLVEMLPEAELLKLNVGPEVVRGLCAKLESLADGKAWRLEAVDTADDVVGLQIRAVLEAGENEEKENEGSQEGFKDEA